MLSQYLVHYKKRMEENPPRLRLWSRMISSGLHESEDEEPPSIPVFSGVLPKRSHKDSLPEALEGAASAFAESLKGKSTDPKAQHAPTAAVSVSPGKAVELQMKNLEQLRYLK